MTSPLKIKPIDLSKLNKKKEAIYKDVSVSELNSIGVGDAEEYGSNDFTEIISMGKDIKSKIPSRFRGKPQKVINPYLAVDGLLEGLNDYKITSLNNESINI